MRFLQGPFQGFLLLLAPCPQHQALQLPQETRADALQLLYALEYPRCAMNLGLVQYSFPPAKQAVQRG